MMLINRMRTVRACLRQLPAASLEMLGAQNLTPSLTPGQKQAVRVAIDCPARTVDRWMTEGYHRIPFYCADIRVSCETLLNLALDKGAREAAFYLGVLVEHSVCTQTVAPGARYSLLAQFRDDAAARSFHARAEQYGSLLEPLYRQAVTQAKQNPAAGGADMGERIALVMATTSADPGGQANGWAMRDFSRLGVFLLTYYAALGCPDSLRALGQGLERGEYLAGQFSNFTPHERMAAAQQMLHIKF